MKQMRKISAILCFIGLFFLLTGCAKDEIAERDIVAFLPTEIFDIKYNDMLYPGTVVSLELVDRSTNKFKGKDKIKAAISIKNDYLECIKYIDIFLSYSDEEWALESYNNYDNDKITVILEPPVPENKLFENLPEDIAMVTVDEKTYPMEITSFEVEKRQTDVSSKTDTSWCVVTMENEYYEYTKYIELEYSYFDVKGGWLLDKYWEDTSKMKYKVKKNPFTETDILDVSPTKDRYSILECNEDFENNTIVYKIEEVTETEYCTIKGLRIKTYVFNGYQWIENCEYAENHEWNILGEYYLERRDENRYAYIDISSFDQNARSVEGHCYFLYSSPFSDSTEYEYYDLSDKEVEVTNNNYSIRILLVDKGVYEDDIVFSTWSANCSYGGRWTNERIWRSNN